MDKKMSDTNQSWQFDPAARMVMGAAGEVICIVPPRQPQAVGQLLASAPMLAAIAHDLRGQLSASLVAWEGEEDSVQEEHAELIADLQAADKRVDDVLGAPGTALSADTLRALATALLESAHQIDGLQPYVVNHSHRHGDTVYTLWSTTPPSEEQMASLVGEEFEENRGETLEYHAMQIREMTGVGDIPPATAPDEEEEEDLGYGPASM